MNSKCQIELQQPLGQSRNGVCELPHTLRLSIFISKLHIYLFSSFPFICTLRSLSPNQRGIILEPPTSYTNLLHLIIKLKFASNSPCSCRLSLLIMSPP